MYKIEIFQLSDSITNFDDFSNAIFFSNFPNSFVLKHYLWNYI